MRPTFTAQPVATNGSPESRAKNRRVELRIAMAKQ
jgi:outer membrane protein OmpA-like peptidoglycan-associated protein